MLHFETPQALWQAICAELRPNMARDSFEKYLRATQALSLENAVLTVATDNNYAREWLEARLASTIRAILVGLLSTSQPEVHFVVMDLSPTEKSSSPAKTGQETGQKAGKKAEQEATRDPRPSETIQSALNALSAPPPRGTFTAEPLILTRYQELVQPHRVVVVDAYALRLLEQGDVSAKDLSLWLGFHQAIWKHWKNGRGIVKNISHEEVIPFAMMSRASYWRALARAQPGPNGRRFIAGGMVEMLPEPGQNPIHNLPNRYRVAMTPRLTHRDLAVIETLLASAVAQTPSADVANQVVLTTLQDLATREVTTWLEEPLAERRSSWPRSLQEVVRQVLGLQSDLSEAMLRACETLYDHLLRAFGKLVVTHYFLRTVVPTLSLSHAQTWAIIALRDRCWFDYETKTQTKFALVRGGVKTLASWVGVSRQAVLIWFNQPAFTQLVQVVAPNLIDLPETWVQEGTLVFEVQQEEPLLDEKDESVDLTPLQKVRLPGVNYETEPVNSETPPGKKRDSPLQKVRLDAVKSETHFKATDKPLPNFNQFPKPPPWRSARTPDAVPVGVGGWDLAFLCVFNRVAPKTRQALLAGGITGPMLVSWVLYAVSLQGHGIQQPLAYALSRVLEQAEGAGGAYDMLAALPPAELLGMAADPTGSQGIQVWQNVMGLNYQRTKMLLEILALPPKDM